VRCRPGAADPAVASRYVPGVDGLDVDRAAETPALALQAAGVTSALARPRSWAGAASRWSAPEPALAVNRMACRRSLRDRNRGRPALASSACRRRRRRCSGTRRSGPPGPAGILRQISHRARPAPGWPWPRSAAPAGAPLPGPAPAHRSPQPPRLTGPRRHPRHRPGRPARWHLVRSRARRCRSAGPGSPRRCVPARPVLAAGGAPGHGNGCGVRSSP